MPEGVTCSCPCSAQSPPSVGAAASPGRYSKLPTEEGRKERGRGREEGERKGGRGRGEGGKREGGRKEGKHN